jgi:NitT/TauT family transport system substrate-binding protein
MGSGIASVIVALAVAAGCTGQPATRATEPLAPAPAAAPAPTARPPAKTVTFGIPKTMNSTILAVAQEKGFFDQENLQGELLIAPPGTAISGVLSGSLDYFTFGSSAVEAAIQGTPVRIVMGWNPRPVHVIIVGSDIRRVEDLAGKAFAVGSVEDSLHQSLRAILRQHGVDPQTVTAIAMRDDTARIAGLTNGAISAAPVSPELLPEAEKLGFRVLFKLSDYIALPTGTLVTSDTKIKQQPDEVRGVIRALLGAARFMRASRPETVAVIAQFLDIGAPEAARLYDDGITTWVTDGRIPEEGLQFAVNSSLIQAGKEAGSVPASQVADFTLLEEVLRQR